MVTTERTLQTQQRGSTQKQRATPAFVEAIRHAMQEPGDRTLPSAATAKQRYNALLAEHATQWRERGFSVIPLRFGTKLPFKGYQKYGTREPDATELVAWENKYGGLAFVLGPASSPDPDYEFVLLDLDDAETARRWREQAGDLSGCIVSPRPKGLHVYFLARSSSLPVHLASRPDKPRKVVPLKRGDARGTGVGELRIRNVIGVAPPTLHPSSTVGAQVWYREESPGEPLTASSLRKIDDVAAFLGPELCEGTLAHTADSQVRAMLHGETPNSDAATFAEAIERVRARGLEAGKPGPKPKREPRPDLPPLLPYSLQKYSVLSAEDRAFSVQRCLPQVVGERERHSLLFAQHMRGYGDWQVLHDAVTKSTNPRLVAEVVKQFWEAQDPALRKDYGTVFDEVAKALQDVRCAIDRDGLQFFIDEAARRAARQEFPPCFKDYADYATADHLRILGLFHVLQEHALQGGLERFYITQQALGTMLLRVSQPTAGKAMKTIEGVFGAIKLIEKGHSGKGSEYVMRCSCDWSIYRKPGG